ncbi:MAG: sugar transferase [Clostridia bacterium]|nr:sugar transferase [Clostridia bacterium]
MKPYIIIKSILDIFLSLIVLIILLPLFLIISIIIELESKGPVFFKQKRIGKDKKIFYIYKFRTMRKDTPKDTPTHMLKNPDTYITKSGRILRRTSIDELPQLINILKGEMSIIGPRPALWNQDNLVEERDKYNANNIKPGLTGWAQVNGRDELEIPIKAKYDGEYIQKISFIFDCKVFIKTIINVFKHDGVVEGSKDKEEIEV